MTERGKGDIYCKEIDMHDTKSDVNIERMLVFNVYYSGRMG